MFVPVHKLLLDYARTLGFGPILLRWRPNMRDFPATFAFCVKANGLATFFIVPKNCILWGAFFEPRKKVASLFAQKLQGFNGNPLYHYCTRSILSVWSALEKLISERRANFLTFFGRTQKFCYQKTSFLHLHAPGSPKDVFSTPLCPEHPLWNLELSIR